MTVRVLRWSERYTKTDMVYLVQGGFWLYLGNAITMAVSLGTAIAFANLLSPELYGNYKYILSVTGVLGALTLSGLGTAVTRSVARGYEGTLSHAFMLMVRWSPLISISAGVAAVYYISQGNLTLGISFVIAGFTLPFITATSLFRPFLVGKKQFFSASILGVIQNTLPAVATIAAVFLTSNVVILIGVYFISQTIVYGSLYLYIKNHLVTNNSIDSSFESLGKHVSVMNFISAVAGRLDSILIFQLLGGTELAIFTFATTIPDQLRGSLKNISALAVPQFALRSKRELKVTFIRKSLLIFVLTAALAALYALIAPYFFAFALPQYVDSIIYSQVYSLSIITSLVLASAYLDSQIAIKEKYFMNIASAFTMIVTSVIGILFFGLWGAIVARVVSRIIISLLASIVIIRH